MSNQKLKPILVTRPLSEPQLAFARDLGLDPLMEPAIRFGFPVISRALLKQARSVKHPVWVFTSQNGVHGFSRSVRSEGYDVTPERVYAVGGATAEAVREETGYTPGVPDRQDAVGLAHLILEDQAVSRAAGKSLNESKLRLLQQENTGSSRADSTREGGDEEGITVIHWCGNKRRPELEGLLREANVLYVPVEVYLTELNKMSFPDREVEAILFYSPSAVEAFRSSIGFSRKLPDLFAIGQTTAEQLSMETGGNVHVPVNPSTEALLRLVAGVLSNRPTT